MDPSGPHEIRRDYQGLPLRRADLPAHPSELFARWFEEARSAEPLHCNEMVLATVAPDGAPEARVVLLKAFDRQGLQFFTDLRSPKALALIQNPEVALVFHWRSAERQVRLRGRARALPREAADDYFPTRPLSSQLAAWASVQSHRIANRAALEKRLREAERRFLGEDWERSSATSVLIPTPPEWGGFRVRPRQFEFWQGRPGRLHDRFRYWQVESAEGWRVERIMP